MVDEIELYRQRKAQARHQKRIHNAFEPDTDVQTQSADLEAYIAKKQERRMQQASVAAFRVENAGNPDENAANDHLAKEYRTYVNPDIAPPVSLVAAHKDHMASLVQRKKNTAALLYSPMLRRWLDNDETNARLAADDIDVLGVVEAGLRNAGNALNRGVLRLRQSGEQVRSEMALYSAGESGMTWAERYKRSQDEDYKRRGGEDYGQGWMIRPLDHVAAWASASLGTVTAFSDWMTGTTKQDNMDAAYDYQRNAAEFARKAQQIPHGESAQLAMDAIYEGETTLLEVLKRTVAYTASDWSSLGSMVALIMEVALESLPMMAAAATVGAVTKSPALAAATMGATSYSMERFGAPVEFFSGKGYDLSKKKDWQRMLANPELMKEAADKGHIRGLIVGVFDAVSGGLAGRILAKNPIADAALQSGVQSFLGGSAEGLAQVATESEVNWADVVLEALAEVGTTPGEVAVIGRRKLGEKKASAKKARENAKITQELSKAATDSKLRARSPEKFREFVESATQDGNLKTMYIPAEAFLDYFQSKNVSIDDIAEVLPGVDIEQVRRAAVTGEDITLPTATYMERVAGSDMDGFVMDNTKFAPDAMTVTEARAFEENRQIEEDRVAVEREAAAQAQEAEQDAAQTVYNDVVGQLVEAGRPKVAAQAEAQLYPAFYKTLAERLGVTTTELLERYRPPKIQETQAETTSGTLTEEEKLIAAQADKTLLQPSVKELSSPVASDPNTYKQEARGRIRIPKAGIQNGQAVIDLFQQADLSTFLHESGHFFLTVLQDAATQEGSPAEIGKMVANTKEWWKSNAKSVAKDGDNGLTEKDVYKYLDKGSTGNAAKNNAIEVGMQEQWARAFETYLMEGKAPTASLQAVFEQFRAWLLEVYRKIKGGLNPHVSDDIRQVFDMLLATDEEMTKARVDNNGEMLAKTAEDLGVSEEEYKHLAALHRQAQDQSAAQAIQSSMAPIRQMRGKQYKARREEIRKEVEVEVNSRPVYRAIEWMGNKRWLGSDGRTDAQEGMRLNKEQLIERYGKSVLHNLPRGRFRVYTPNGMDIDEAAGWFGFPGGDEMIQGMKNAPKRTDLVIDETNTRAMGELAQENDDLSVLASATDAFHADRRGDYIAAELRTLHKVVGDKTTGRTSTASYARQIAKRTIMQMRVRDAIASNRYLAAERRAGEQAQEAFAKGDKHAAADFKRRQLFNHMMFVESRRIAEETGKTERLAKRLGSKSTRKNLAVDYLEAIDDVLELYDFRKIGPGKEKSRERMLAYVEMMKEQGRENEIAIPSDILENAKAEPYMTLSVELLRGVHDTLKNIEHTARRAGKLIDAKLERDMEQIVNDVSDAFAANIKSKPPSRVETAGERWHNKVRGFLLLSLNADTLLREIDGFEDTYSAAYRNIKGGIDKAAGRLQVRRQEEAKKFDDLFSVYKPKERNKMTVVKFVPELSTSMAKWDLISIVLNMGNAGNIQRLTDPNAKGSFTQAQLDAVLAMMDRRDLDFIQSVWDYVDSFYSEIAAREKRVTGVAPQKVPAQEVHTPHGTYKGGYYPLKYDPRLSNRVAEETAEEVTNNMRAGRFGKAQTKNGHTKERSRSSGRAVLLDIGVLHSHVDTVLHDLEMSEEVTNTWRILQDPRIKSLFLDNGRQIDHHALELWAQDVASGQVRASDTMSRVARRLKSNFTLSKLSFNLSTVMIQLTGISQSMVVIGKKNFFNGAVMYAKNPLEARRDVKARSSFMKERETTFNKDIYDLSGDPKTGPEAGGYRRFQQNIMIPAGFCLMTKVQFYGVDMPTWLGAYQKALKDTGNDEVESIQTADRAVARAQASGLFSDRSAIERGTLNAKTRQSDYVRILSTLGSYMFTKGNVAYERTKKTDFRSPTEVLSYTIDMALLFTIEAILLNLIRGELPGMGDDDDEGWTKFLAKETGFSIMSTMPVIRDAASALQGYGGGGAYGSIIKTVTKPLYQAAQGELDRGLAKSLFDVAGLATGLPSTAAWRIGEGARRQATGEDVSPMEYILGRKR